MAPQALASIHALFPAHERGRALSIYGIVLGLASIAGQLLGGVLVGADLGGFGWRLIFLVNLPVAVIAFFAAIPLLRETRGATRPRLDIGGVALSAATLAALVLPLIEGRELGWPWWSIALLAATPLLAEAFRRYEIRLARAGGEPLVAIEIFRSRGLLRGLGAIGTLYAMAAFFLTFAIYLQSGLGCTALQSGLAILPFSIAFLVGSFLSPMVGARFGAAAPSVGFAVSATGLVGLATVVFLTPSATMPAFAPLSAALSMMGLGMGMTMPTMMRVVIERVEQRRAGLVGGMVNSTLQATGAMFVAALGGVFFAVLGLRGDFGKAFAVTMLLIAVFHTLGALLAAGLGQRRSARIAAAKPAQAREVANRGRA